MVLKLISWKHSFKRLKEEYETAKKKKQALDNLLNAGRISQSTFDLFNKEINEAIVEIERQEKALLEKINSKMKELEERIKMLEMFFANFEIQHVTGEVDEEVYQREIALLSMGLETAKHELDAIREAANQLSSAAQIPATNVVVQQEIEQQPQEVSQPKAEVVEEQVSIALQSPEETKPAEAEGGEKQEG